MQTTLTDSGAVTHSIPSTRRVAEDLDFLSARLHARRSRMAEGERLHELCSIKSLQEFSRTIFPDHEFTDAPGFQRQCVHDLAWELYSFRPYLAGPGAELFDWLLIRFQMENLKVMLRGYLRKTPVDEVESYLVTLPKGLAMDFRKLATAETREDLVRLLPKGFFQKSMKKAVAVYRDHSKPFFLEAALDSSYFAELNTRMEKLKGRDREMVRPLIHQETDIFHLMLVTRGRFHYHLAPDSLQPFHVTGTRIPRALFFSMLRDTESSAAIGRVVGRVLDGMPPEDSTRDGSNSPDPSVVEGLAWQRFVRMANLAFRQSHMGLGTVIGYAALRRVETANLITISEGIRSGMSAGAIRGRLIPRGMEGMHV